MRDPVPDAWGSVSDGAPRIFLSYEFAHDADRAAVVRAAWSAQGGVVETESVDPCDDSSIRRWIDLAVAAASVTVVLVGSHTGASRWVDYEIGLTKALGNGLLGVDVSGIADRFGRTSTCTERLPVGYPFYDWVGDVGVRNMRSWVDRAFGFARSNGGSASGKGGGAQTETFRENQAVAASSALHAKGPEEGQTR